VLAEVVDLLLCRHQSPEFKTPVPSKKKKIGALVEESFFKEDKINLNVYAL
jgi:hypothetical protein